MAANVSSQSKVLSSGLDHKAPGEHVYDGVLFAEAFPAAVLDRVKTFEFDDEDVLVATWPKAGTTWMQEILYLVMNDADTEKALSIDLWDRVPFMELQEPIPNKPPHIDILANASPPRLIKTHLQRHFFDRMLATKKTKVIVVMRNVKDCLVSYYHFYRAGKGLGEFSGTFEQFLELDRADRLIHGGWFAFNLSWWEQRDNPNVMFTTYEDMSADLGAVIRKVAQFLGRTLSDEQVTKICQHVCFDNMKDNSRVVGVFENFMNAKVSKFMRKGKVGDWRNHFSPEQSEEYDRLYAAKMGHTGLVFDYGK